MTPKRIEISPSKVKTYLNCPALYRSRYMTAWNEKSREPNSPVQDAGTIVHKILELAGRDYIAKRRTEPVSLQYLLDILEWVLRAMPDDSWKAQTQLRTETIKLVTEVLAKTWSKVDFTYTVQVEQRWEVNLGPLDPLDPNGADVWAVGIFDRVDQLPDGSIIVVDYKVGFDVMSRSEAELDPQGNLYVIAAKDKYSKDGDVDVGFELHYLSRNVRIGPIRWDVPRDTWMRQTLTAAQYRITKETGFPETPGLPHCVYCPLQGKCESFKKFMTGPLRILGSSLAENARDYNRLRTLVKLATDLKERNGAKLEEAVRNTKHGSLYVSGFKAELTFTPRLDYKDFHRTVSSAAKGIYEATKIAAEAAARRQKSAQEALEAQGSPVAVQPGEAQGAQADESSVEQTAPMVDSTSRALDIAEARILELTETVRKQQVWIEVASKIGRSQKSLVDEFISSLPAEVADMVFKEVAPTGDDAGYSYLNLSELDNPFPMSEGTPTEDPQDEARATISNPLATEEKKPEVPLVAAPAA